MRLLSVILLFTISSLSGQELDSLEGQLNSAIGDEKISILTELAATYYLTDSTKSSIYANKAIEEISKLGRDERLNSTNLLAKELYYLGAVNIAKAVLDSGAELVSNDSLSAEWYYRYGGIEYKKGNKQKAMDNFQKSLNLSKALSHKDFQARALNYMANNMVDDGMYSNALNYYQRALDVYISDNDSANIADLYNNIARLYQFKGEHDTSIEYFNKSFAISQNLNDTDGMAIVFNNIGYVKKIQGQYEEALIYFNKAIDPSLERDYHCSEIYPIYNIGSVLVQLNQPDSARYYLEKSLEGAKQCSDQYIEAIAKFDLGQLAEKEGDIDLSLSYYLEAYKIARRNDLRTELNQMSETISNAYEKNNELQKSIDFLKIHNNIEDSIFNVSSLQQIARLEADYQYEAIQKEQRIKEIEREKELQKSRYYQIILITGITSLVIIILVLVYYSRKKQQAFDTMKKLNEELKLKSAQLQAANNEISKINNSLEEKVKRRTSQIKEQRDKIVDYMFYNSHQVRGPLARILGLVQIFRKDQPSSEEFRKMINDLKNESEVLDHMVKEMNRRLEEERN